MAPPFLQGVPLPSLAWAWNPQHLSAFAIVLAHLGGPASRIGHQKFGGLFLSQQRVNAFTNSANRVVINSAIASTSQLSGGQLLPGRSLGTGLPFPLGLLLFNLRCPPLVASPHPGLFTVREELPDQQRIRCLGEHGVLCAPTAHQTNGPIGASPKTE